MTETGAFGARLRACRQSAGLSQEILAEPADLSDRAVGNLERGRSGPRPATTFAGHSVFSANPSAPGRGSSPALFPRPFADVGARTLA